MAKKSKKQPKTRVKPPKIDGLSPENLKRVTSAIRQVWSWSYPRRLAVARATGADGFPRCEKCKKRVPKIFVDHITPVGEVRSPGFIDRLWCPSSGLQCLCRKCHAPKTKSEAAARAEKRKQKKEEDGYGDFF